MNYQEEKAKRCYELYLRGKTFKKVYATVEKDGKFIVLKFEKDGNVRYQLAGGSVEDGEENSVAIKREVLEELNVEIEIVKSLGFIHYPTSRRYQDKEFELECEAEIFLTKFVSYRKNKNIGLDGEFNLKTTNIAEITKEEMLNSVAEFSQFGLKF